MNPKARTKEIQRLIKSFEYQADQFHNLTLSIEYLERGQASLLRPVKNKRHGIFLWQFVGAMKGDNDANVLAKTIASSDLKWGIPGSELTCIAVVEGSAVDIFVAMARRAGSIFLDDESSNFKARLITEIMDTERAKNPGCKTVASSNDHPIAVWINYLLYYISKTHPGREKSREIEPDPFSLSLLALEDFQSQGEVAKMTPPLSKLSNIDFKIALSFPGEKRGYVEQVADNLKAVLGRDAVFYDLDYQAQLCQPNADIILQNIYHRQSQLIVVFLCKEYSLKEWCGLELRAIRDLIKRRQGGKLVLVRFDDANVDGFYSIDGYLDANKFSPEQISEFILQNLQANTAQ